MHTQCSHAQTGTHRTPGHSSVPTPRKHRPTLLTLARCAHSVHMCTLTPTSHVHTCVHTHEPCSKVTLDPYTLSVRLCRERPTLKGKSPGVPPPGRTFGESLCSPAQVWTYLPFLTFLTFSAFYLNDITRPPQVVIFHPRRHPLTWTPEEASRFVPQEPPCPGASAEWRPRPAERWRPEGALGNIHS